MGRNCLVEYLTPACATCPDWLDGTNGHGVGCGIHGPIMDCRAFREMWESENKVQEKEMMNLPLAIYLETTNGEIILMEATSSKEYTKGYYSTERDPITNRRMIRRVKYVNLPVHPDGYGVPISYVHTLFEFLQTKKGYKLYTPEILE